MINNWLVRQLWCAWRGHHWLLTLGEDIPSFRYCENCGLVKATTAQERKEWRQNLAAELAELESCDG